MGMRRLIGLPVTAGVLAFAGLAGAPAAVAATGPCQVLNLSAGGGVRQPAGRGE